MPGTMLGTYKVVGQSVSNTCGLAAPNPWTFDIQLSEENGSLYWNWLDGSPLLQGALTQQTAIITQSQTDNVDSTDAGLGPCNLERNDTMNVTLASGSPPGSFGGTLGYSFSVPSGSTCSDQLASAGGMYNALPCSVSYMVSATRQ
jgi:hypothetical protein